MTLWLLIACARTDYGTCDPVALAELSSTWSDDAETARRVDPVYAERLDDLSARLRAAIPASADPRSSVLENLDDEYELELSDHTRRVVEPPSKTRYFPAVHYLSKACGW